MGQAWALDPLPRGRASKNPDRLPHAHEGDAAGGPNPGLDHGSSAKGTETGKLEVSAEGNAPEGPWGSVFSSTHFCLYQRPLYIIPAVIFLLPEMT